MKSKPFVFGVAIWENNFTDRVDETARLKNNFTHGVNTILISPRRLGKTSLVRKVSGIVQSNTLKVVFLDIFSCRSEHDFYNAFASAVLKQTSSKFDEFVENAKKFLTRITPRFNVGTDPINDFSLSLEWNTKENDVDEILQLPEKIAQKKNIRIVVCIDEFQQIGEFSNSTTFQKKLRAVWQLQHSVSYCLFGSKKHLMAELFEKRSLPFYKFGDTIHLPKISTADWVIYICQQFEKTGKNISADLAIKICLAVDNHSSYVQQLAWLVWIYTNEHASEQDFNNAHKDLIDQNSLLFEKQTESLSSYQMNFLRALTDDITSEFTTKENLKKYDLGTSANVSIIKRALLKKELIEKEKNKVTLIDPVLKLWLEREFKNNY